MSLGPGGQAPAHPPASEESTAALDSEIAALFQSAEEPLTAASQAAFCARLERDVRRLRRRRRLQSAVLALTAVLGVTGLILRSAPALARLANAAAWAGSAGLLHIGGWLVGPAGWSVSLVLGGALLWRLRTGRG